MQVYPDRMFSLNPQSGTPIYRQLMEQIRHMIAGAQLVPGDSLPSVRELAMQHAVNPMTISKAYSLLETEGLLERQRGKGMVVAESASLESKAMRLKRLEQQLDQLLLAAEQLQLDQQDILNAIRQKMEDNND